MGGLVVRSCLVAAWLSLGFVAANAQGSLRLKALPLGDRGVVEDLSPSDWKVKVGDRDAKVISQRTPKEVGKDGQNWVFVFMPVRDPEMRRLAVHSVANFVSSLPATDSVLVVARTMKGLESFTPGATTRPSLWAKALDRVLGELPARLEGNSEPTYSLPSSPVGEKEEGMEPIQALLLGLPARKMEFRANDISTGRQSIIENYSADSLGSVSKNVCATLSSLEGLCEAIAKLSGEKQIVVISRGEIDDLASPVWANSVSSFSMRDTLNSRLQAEMMIRDITLARMSLSAKLNQLGLTIHSIGGRGANYGGAFGEAASNSGGFQYRFESSLVARFSQLLPLWATRYELELALPAGISHPAKIDIETTRKNIRLFVPSVR